MRATYVLLCVTLAASTATAHVETSHKELFAQHFGQQIHKDAVSLLQVDAKKALPQVSSLLAQPDQLFEALTTKMSAMKEKLIGAQSQNAAAISMQKSEYDLKLKEQSDKNQELKQANNGIAKEIDDLHHSNAQLRRQTEELSAQCASLQADLKSMQGNISVAQEFVENVLDMSASMLNRTSSELSVLAYLDEQDDRQAQDRSHRARLNAVGNVALLQVESKQEPEHTSEHPKDMLQELVAQLQELSDKQNESAESLKDEFENELQQGEILRASLLQNQTALNATRASAMQLQSQLIVAVKHVTEVRDQLLERKAALRQYALHVAGNSTTKPENPVSFLQLAKGVNKKLPDVNDVMSKPKQVLEQMNTDVQDLATRLIAEQDITIDIVSKKKTELQARLTDQRHRITAISKTNANISKQIAALRISSETLRAKSSRLIQENKDLRQDMLKLQKNMTTAQEFTDIALDSLKKKLDTATELDVLHQLDVEDAARAENASRAAQLRSMDLSRKLAMFQFGAEQTSNPQEMINALISKLTSLSDAQNSSIMSLQNKFDAMYQEGETKYQELIAEQSGLNSTLKSETETNSRLMDAVNHLSDTQAKLKKDQNSIWQYVQKIGNPSLVKAVDPMSLAKTGAAVMKPHEDFAVEKLHAAKKAAHAQKQEQTAKSLAAKQALVKTKSNRSLYAKSATAPSGKVGSAAKAAEETLKKKEERKKRKEEKKLAEEKAKKKEQRKKLKKEKKLELAKLNLISVEDFFHVAQTYKEDMAAKKKMANTSKATVAPGQGAATVADTHHHQNTKAKEMPATARKSSTSKGHHKSIETKGKSAPAEKASDSEHHHKSTEAKEKPGSVEKTTDSALVAAKVKKDLKAAQTHESNHGHKHESAKEGSKSISAVEKAKTHAKASETRKPSKVETSQSIPVVAKGNKHSKATKSMKSNDAEPPAPAHTEPASAFSIAETNKPSWFSWLMR